MLKAVQCVHLTKTISSRPTDFGTVYFFTKVEHYNSNPQLLFVLKTWVVVAKRLVAIRGGAGGDAGAGGARGRGGGGSGGATPSYARNPPRDPVLYDELEVHWGATARYIHITRHRSRVRAALSSLGDDYYK